MNITRVGVDIPKSTFHAHAVDRHDLRYGSRMERLARRTDIDEVWLCISLDQQVLIDRVLRDFRHSTAAIRLVPSLHGMRLIQHPVVDMPVQISIRGKRAPGVC
jgi:protein gp37